MQKGSLELNLDCPFFVIQVVYNLYNKRYLKSELINCVKNYLPNNICI